MKPSKISAKLSSANVGIITALPEEYAAVCEVFSCNNEIGVPGTGAGRKYSLCKVKTAAGGTHVVAIALLNDMGNNSSAIRATQMIQHCPNVEHFIMVGIAGAVPSPSKPEVHVRLGDIVVTDRNGVVQYDLDKEEPGLTKHRHPPRPPGAALLEAVRSLSTGEILNKRPWEMHLSNIASKLGKDWKRPAESGDILRDLAEDVAKAQHPKDPKRVKGQPRVFHGPIASANKLLKNPSKRDRLRDAFGVKAVEMEGSGIADASWNLNREYLVVRGTCDYCNPTKGDEWHRYAALAAAAYSRCVVESLVPTGILRSVVRQKTKSKKRLPNKETKRVMRERDVKQVKKLFYWFNVTMLDNFVNDLLNGRLRLAAMDFADFFGVALNSASFHLYDTKLKKLILEFYKAWRRCLIHSDSMDVHPNNSELYFRTPGNFFSSSDQERKYREMTSQAMPLRRALDAVLDYVRLNYIEIDLSETGKEAVGMYFEEERKDRGAVKKMAKKK